MIKKIGITEMGDVSFELSVFDKLEEANIIITKRLTNELIIKLLQHKEKCILHLTVTGMGGTKIEPLVPPKETMLEKLNDLIIGGFPIKQVVLRIDPIVPTPKGINTAISVIDLFSVIGITRIRYSSLDMYNHVKDRFRDAKIKTPYDTFHASKMSRDFLYNRLSSKCDTLGIDLEACAEFVPEKNKIGCISQKDLDILGIDIELGGSSGQRKGCLCPSNKKELLRKKPSQCVNGCLYCFWK